MTEEKKFKGSLKLDWINKDKSLYYEIDESEGRGIKPIWVDKEDIRVSEPRILNFVKSYGDETSENMLIRGDNLLVLRTLVEQFKNKDEKDKVKCIYIDPPYNTGNAFEKYDDNLKHSEWLTMMRDRLVLLKRLLRKDGSIFIQIDNTEMAYLKVLMDEIFGRDNYITTIIVQMRHPERILKGDKDVHDIMEFILFYCKSRNHFKILKSIKDTSDLSMYKYQIVEKKSGIKIEVGKEKEVYLFKPDEYEIVESKDFKKSFRKENIREGLIDRNSSCRFYRDYLMKRLQLDGYGSIYKVIGLGERGDGIGYRYIMHPKSQKYHNGQYFQGIPLKKENSKEMPLPSFIDVSEVMASQECSSEGGVQFPQGKKSEWIIKKCLDLCLFKSGDLVLDIFLGCGSTAATAHKMGGRYLGIEIGIQAEEKCIPRLKNVIEGDITGISEAVNWKGGGGFKYYKLGESLISGKDINWNLTYEQIAEALFYTKNFKLMEDKDLAKNKIFLAENRNEKGVYAICSVSKDLEFIKFNEYSEIVEKIKKIPGFKELNIYTNKAINVRKNDQENDVFIRKIPQTILKKYKLI
jgi:adenine-specific DNA-methyltransferase